MTPLAVLTDDQVIAITPYVMGLVAVLFVLVVAVLAAIVIECFKETI